MKFTLFAIVAALCIFSVSADVSLEGPLSTDLEYLDQLDLILDFYDYEQQTPETTSWAGFVNFLKYCFSWGWRIITIALRTVKGFNCLIKWTIGVQTTLLKFNLDAAKCGATAAKDFVNVLKLTHQTLNTTYNIIHMKDTICAEEVTGNKVLNSCTVKVIVQFFKLFGQTKNLVVALKNIPKTGSTANVCMKNAVGNMTTYFTNCPQTIYKCSALTSS